MSAPDARSSRPGDLPLHTRRSDPKTDGRSYQRLHSLLLKGQSLPRATYKGVIVTRFSGLYLVALTLWLAACGATPTTDDTSSTGSERTLAPGTFVINPQFDDALSFSEGLAAVRIGDSETGKWGYIDTTGQMVINPRFDGVSGFTDGLAVVLVDDDERGKYGFIDTTGEMVITLEFDSVTPFLEGLAAIQIGDKWGFIDTTGQVVIDPQFDNVYGFFEGLTAVQIGDSETGKWGFIDTTGQMVINPQFERAGLFVEGLALVAVDGGTREYGFRTLKYGLIDTTGQMVITPQFDDALVHGSGFRVTLTWSPRFRSLDEQFQAEPGQVRQADSQDRELACL